MQVLLPALRADMASLPLPSDRLRPANPAQATKQAKNTEFASPNPSASLLTAQHCTKGFAPFLKAADLTNDLCSHPSRQGGSQQSSAASTSSILDAEAAAPSDVESIAAESTTAFEAAAVADDIPIQPLNKQTADGTCVSPNIGRRSTPFSTSEPSCPSAPTRRHDTSATAAEAFSQHGTTLQDDVILSRRSARDLAEGSWQETPMQVDQQEASGSMVGDCNGASGGCGEQPDGCEQRRYLTCCVRLSEEKEPHR